MEHFSYNHLNTFLKNKFGVRTLKVSIDGGFTCPNRDGKCGWGGCIFCGGSGSGHSQEKISISKQIENHLNSYRGKRAEKFIAYFQSFTNTYDSVQNLKKKYDEAFNSSDKIVALAIATRPDCIDDENAKLIASYKQKGYVWVELGFQTSNETTAKIINRGYNNQVFENAVKILRKYDIDVVVHIMVGLPGENKQDAIKTAKYLNNFDLAGIKIHSTYITKNTALEKLYLEGKYNPITLEEYKDSVIEILCNLNPKFIIHRISGDAPKDELVAPEWNVHKKLVLNGVENEMKTKGLYQGIFFQKTN